MMAPISRVGFSMEVREHTKPWWCIAGSHIGDLEERILLVRMTLWMSLDLVD